MIELVFLQNKNKDILDGNNMREAQISVNNTLITGMYGASKSDAKNEYI